MSFANPAGRAKDGADDYIRSLLTLLGDRDPLEVQEEMLAMLGQTLDGISEEMLGRPEGEGKWSIREVVQHLADNELVHTYRMRRILAEPTPELEGFDQDHWAKRLDYAGDGFKEALDLFRALRASNLRLLRSLSDEELDRFGLHSERGQESVRRISQLIAAHDLVHQNQIARIKGKLGLSEHPQS